MILNENIKIAFFDVDGTLVNNGSVPSEVISGIKSLRKNGFLTSLVSGRGFNRLYPAFGVNVNKIVSPNIPMILEHGGRVLTSKKKYIFYKPLSLKEIDLSIKKIEILKRKIEFFGYFPKKLNKKAVIYTFREKFFSNLKKKYKFANSFLLKNAYHTLKTIKDENPCMLMIRPISAKTILDFGKSLNTITNEGFYYINSKGINKATSLTSVIKKMKVKYENVLIAGNDMNDLEMFKYNFGKKIFVGDKIFKEIELSKNIIKVKSPKHLGTYLRTLKIT